MQICLYLYQGFKLAMPDILSWPYREYRQYTFRSLKCQNDIRSLFIVSKLAMPDIVLAIENLGNIEPILHSVSYIRYLKI